MPLRDLEGLPNELLLAVMSSVSTPADILKMVSASPVCWRLYANHENVIAESVVKRAILDENMPLALAAVTPPAIRTKADLDSRIASQDHWPGPADRLEIQESLKALRQERENSTSDNIPYYWPRLFKLCLTVDSFIDKFCTRQLPNLKVLRDPGDIPLNLEAVAGGGSTSLSSIEYGRLQRAFFRFELCRKFFKAALLTFNWHSIIIEDFLQEALLKPMPSEQRAELCSVFSFLEQCVLDTFGQAERLVSSRIDSLLEKIPIVSVLGFPRLLPRVGLGVFEGAGYQCPRRFYVDSLVDLGLPFLRYLWKLKRDKQLAIICNPYFRRYSANLDKIFRREIPSGQGDDFSGDDQVDCLSQPNFMWRQEERSMRESAVYHTVRGLNLTELGFVFWDKTKLENAGYAEAELTAHAARDFYSYAESVEAFHRRGQWSLRRPGQWNLHEKFAGITILDKALETLRPEPYIAENEKDILSEVEY